MALGKLLPQLRPSDQEALIALVWPQMQQLGQTLAEYSGVAARATGAAAGQESLETSGLKRRWQVHTATAVLGERRADSALGLAKPRVLMSPPATHRT